MAGAVPPSVPDGLTAERPTSGRFVETPAGFMIPYTLVIPGTDIAVPMVPVPGGTFMLGSPPDETGRTLAEGPQIKVRVEPFWMARTETTWEQFHAFMAMEDAFKGFAQFEMRRVTEGHVADAVTAPSHIYDLRYPYANGDDPRLPAVTLSQYNAKQYTKWLSGLTGHVYRLPSEAEWEYAAKAGTTTPWSFGDDAATIDEYAWTFTNCAGTHPVGLKKPNPWGLCDMHGNVAEWVLDAYNDEGFTHLAGKSQPVAATDAVLWPKTLYPRVIKGGSYTSKASAARSAARFGSDDDEWRAVDPEFPQSPWWFTEEAALGVGFRVIRPLTPTKAEERTRFWDADIKSLREDVEHRTENEGRGRRGLVDPGLPAAIKELEAKRQQHPMGRR